MKSVLITGASKGVGYATALSFAKDGHEVLAMARNGNLLTNLQKESASLPGKIFTKEADITKFELNDLPEEFQSIDILILNAGALVNKPFSEISREELEHIYKVNVFAPFEMVQKLKPRLSSSAHIIGIGSAGGYTGTQKFSGLSAYSSSKAALSCLMECLNEEFAKTDLAFNCLALGSVQTEMLEKAFPGYKASVSPSEMANYIKDFAINAPWVIRGKTILVSKTNP